MSVYGRHLSDFLLKSDRATTTSQTIEIESFLHSIGISMSKITNMDENLLRHSPFDEV